MFNRSALVLASVALIATMFLLVSWLTGAVGASADYVIVFCICWFAFCLQLRFIFQGRDASRRLSLAAGETH